MEKENIARRVSEYLSDPTLTIEYRESVTSTNTILRELAEAGAKEGRVLIAGEQTAGRGSRGRSFYSPCGSGLYMSLLLRPKLPPESATLITPCAAVSVAETIEDVCRADAKIKWVNDIYISSRKVCGILTEARFSPEGPLLYAVLGVGINLTPPEGGFPREIEAIAAPVLAEGEGDMRALVAAGAIKRFMGYYRDIEKKPFLEAYRRRSLLTGRAVTVNGERQASVLGIDDDFGLMVQYENGSIETLRSGEVSIK